MTYAYRCIRYSVTSVVKATRKGTEENSCLMKQISDIYMHTHISMHAVVNRSRNILSQQP